MKPVRYPILLVDQLRPADRATVTADTALCLTDGEARVLAQKQGWVYEFLDLNGRVGVLKYKGVEVVLFFKRQLTYTEPGPADPLPECVLSDPDDAWMKLEALGPSARQVNERLKYRKENYEYQISTLESELYTKRAMLEAVEQERDGLREEVSGLKLANELRRGYVQKQRNQGFYEGVSKVLSDTMPLYSALRRAEGQPMGQWERLRCVLFSLVENLYISIGARLVTPLVGDKFDPAEHNAVGVDPAYAEGLVAKVLDYGLWYQRNLIKAAQVAVGGRKDGQGQERKDLAQAGTPPRS